MTLPPIPTARLRPGNDAPLRKDRAFVLYWMTSARRPGWSFALQHAAARAQELRRPLVVLEALRCGYAHASDRHHRFVLDGMADHQAHFARAGVRYYPYVEETPNAGRGLLAALGRSACVVIGDDYPAFFLPRMLRSAAAQLDVRLELVDGNGLHVLQEPQRPFATAYAFRRWLQRTLITAFPEQPLADPLQGLTLPSPPALPAEITRRWPPAAEELLQGAPHALLALPIDHGVGAVALRGGFEAARRRLQQFVPLVLSRYLNDGNHPDREATSGLSPWLHFGHLSTHEVLAAVAESEQWNPGRLSTLGNGAREGFWGMTPSAESFLDQIVTWRELGFNAALHSPGYDTYDGVPEWARKTLEAHVGDPRPALYPLEALERAETGDAVWNAAQRELLREGRIHNYLRMVWGKRMLEWTPSPRRAAEILVLLNDRYALDGRDPNSYSGIFWTFGRYDRPWAPVRKIFGSVRYMSSANTVKKLRMKAYLARYGSSPSQELGHVSGDGGRRGESG